MIAGPGHGSYVPAIIFFPFCMLSIVSGHTITIPFLLLAIFQFPAYGLILDTTARTRKFKFIVIGLAIIHIVLSISLVNLSGERWH